jgi:hypothetical protein
MSNTDKPKVVTTRWWWVRHAPVRSDGGNIYGQEDITCDTSDTEVFEAVAKMRCGMRAICSARIRLRKRSGPRAFRSLPV